eukprot:560236-Heterocapsa_arctica.AAC.1
MHLCFTVDSATKKQRMRATVVGLLMRVIMGKFNIPSTGQLDKQPYLGGQVRALTAVEAVQVNHIKAGDLYKKKATI